VINGENFKTLIFDEKDEELEKLKKEIN